jgi:polysaccharide deacetylase family protein (PEP-CTERM system associated)
MERILAALDSADARATFFFLGWIAERRPDLVLRCHEAGHEVASHGYEHLFLWDLGPERLDQDLARSEDAILAAGAPRPIGFRASTFTLTRRTLWALDVLVRRGYTYDSSVHPVHHPTYGIPDFDPDISRVVAPGGGSILEFPVATYPFLGGRAGNLPIGGGGYFRLLPGALHRRLFASLIARGRRPALYLHPWEFDPDQPRVPAPPLARFRHYLGLKRSLPRLESLLRRFPCGTMQEVLRGAKALAP